MRFSGLRRTWAEQKVGENIIKTILTRFFLILLTLSVRWLCLLALARPPSRSTTRFFAQEKRTLLRLDESRRRFIKCDQGHNPTPLLAPNCPTMTTTTSSGAHGNSLLLLRLCRLCRCLVHLQKVLFS